MSDQDFFDELLKQMDEDETEVPPEPITTIIEKPRTQAVTKIPERPKIEKPNIPLEVLSDQFIKTFEKINQEVKPKHTPIAKRLKMLFMRAKNKHIGDFIYLGENGDQIGTIVDIKLNDSRNIVSYAVSDNTGITIHLPVKNVEEFDEWLVLQPAWYIEGRQTVRRLKLQEKIVADIAFMQASGDLSEDRISDILDHANPELRNFIEESKRICDNLKICHDRLEMERAKLSKKIFQLFEKRLLESIQKKDFVKEMVVIRRKAKMLDKSIWKSKELLVSLNSSPFLIYYQSKSKDVEPVRSKVIGDEEKKAKALSLAAENADNKLKEEMKKLRVLKEEMKMLKIEPRLYPSDEKEENGSFVDMAKIFNDSIKRLNTDLGIKETVIQLKEEKKDLVSPEMSQKIETTKQEFSDFVKAEILSKLESKRRQKDVDLNALAELDKELGPISSEYKAEVRKPDKIINTSREDILKDELLADLVRDSALEFTEQNDDDEDFLVTKNQQKKKDRSKK